MAVCKFWTNGFCRNGSSCRFEHPPKNQSGNRFSALSGNSNQGSNRNQNQDPAYGITAEIIQRDLVNDLPGWILSCYGPTREAPEQLFGGYPREQSFEEVRLHYLQGAAAGNPDGALAEIQGLYQNAQQQIQHTLANVKQAIQFIVDAGDKHPNRIDVCKGSMPASGTQNVFAKSNANNNPFGGTSNAFQNNASTSNAFGAPAAGGSAFGQSSALGQKPSAFGGPSAFGQPSQPAGTSAFGQPATTSAFGQPAAPPAFGQPATASAFGQPATGSAFGQPSALGGTPAFGQPSQPASAFGQASALGAKPSAFGAPAFGQPAQPAAASAFGQPSQPAPAFGQPSQPTPAFGQPSQPAAAPAFGQPSQPASAFGQPAALGQTQSPFAAAAAAGASPFATAAQQQPPANAFGQPAQPAQSVQTNAFGQPAAAPTTGAFGQPTPSATSAPYGQPQQPASPASAFGATAAGSAAPAFGAPAAAPVNAFGAQPAAQQTPAPAFGAPGQQQQQQQQQPEKSPYAPNATRQHPDISTYSSQGPDNRLRMFKGKAVAYQPLGKDLTKEVPVIRSFDGSVAKIWFPEGAPTYTPDTEAQDQSVYNDPGVQQMWGVFVNTGSFAGGIMPEVPPKREFCAWDF